MSATSGATRVLVVEDDEAIADGIRYGLGQDGFDVQILGDGEGALAAPIDDFDAVVLDVMLPGQSGIDVCREIRSRSVVPILMLTARTTELDRVLGLEVGADDYLSKPFSMAELKARIESVLRRQRMDQDGAPTRLTVGEMELDLGAQRAAVRGVPVELTSTEFRLLALLARNPEHTFPRQDIVRHLWRSEYSGDTRSLDVHVRNLRRKVEEDPTVPRLVVTVRGVGYQVRAD